MSIELVLRSVASLAIPIFEERRTVARYKRELIRHRHTEAGLRRALAREEALLREKDELIRQQAVMSQESDHRLLNGLQMIISLLSLQSRASTNAEVTLQLAAAADRIATIGRIHHRLHSLDGVQTFALKRYLKDLCSDFSVLLSSVRPMRIIAVEGIELDVPAVTAIPLSFIANKLVTNAVKYGSGRITVSLENNPARGYALSISDERPGLPEGFDPDDRKGLGMRIIKSLLKQVGGELRIGRNNGNQGAQFIVMFAYKTETASG